MKRLVPLVIVGVLLAACGDSTDSGGAAPGGGAGTESDEVGPETSVPVETAEVPVDSGPVATPEVDSTEPPVTDSPATDPPTTDPPTTDPPATEPPPSEPLATDPPSTDDPTDRVVRFFAGNGTPGSPWVPLGHWDGANWQDLQFTDEGSLVPVPPSPIASVAATSLDLPDGPTAVIPGLSLGPEEPYCVGDEAGPLISLPAELPQTPVSMGYDAVAVTADWPLQPREVRQVGLEVPEYATIGASFFPDRVETAGQGNVVQAVRVDLDGNGVEEVLVTYERQESTDFGGEGDFSSVYARYPSADGTVVDEIVTVYISSEPTDFPTPGRYTIAAVADLNGDGVMEVMVRDRFWEAGGMQVFALVDGRLTRVGAGGCGV